jgi:hypothetical protein
MVVKDADRPVFGTWFGLVQKDLGSGGTLPSAYAVTLPIEMLIRTLAATGMSMMTGTITGQVLHHRVHPETLLMQVWYRVRSAVGLGRSWTISKQCAMLRHTFLRMRDNHLMIQLNVE